MTNSRCSICLALLTSFQVHEREKCSVCVNEKTECKPVPGGDTTGCAPCASAKRPCSWDRELHKLDPILDRLHAIGRQGPQGMLLFDLFLDFAQILALGLDFELNNLLGLTHAYNLAWQVHEQSRQSLLALGESIVAAREHLSASLHDPRVVFNHLEGDLDFEPTDENLEKLAGYLGWNTNFTRPDSGEASGSN